MYLEELGKIIGRILSDAHANEKSDRIRQGIQRFKMDMMKHMPFYGDIMMRIPLYEDESVETALTDGRCIRYNPGFFKTMNEGQRNYVYMHEVLHILFMHWKRKAGRDAQLWNIACDYVVNGTLDQMRWRMENRKIAFERPREGCFSDRSYNLPPAEEFYAVLAKENESRPESKPVYKGKRIIMLPKDLLKVLSEASGEDGNESKEEEITEKMVRELIRETAKRRGTSGSFPVPEQILRLTQTRRLPWNKLLYEFLSEREDEESSYLTPERKYIHMDLIIPGISKTENELGEIWAFVDSSGSIGGNELLQFMTQLYRISKEFRCVFNIAFWDTSVTDVYRNVKNREKILECRPKHSGGTDINCVYTYLRENKIKPGVMIILTDGYYGRLNEPAGKLRKRTILVISENGAVIDEKNDIGKLARL